MNDTKISVIIPVYNAQNTLEKCVESILNVIQDTDEIIIIDDMSNDNSKEVIMKLENSDKRIVSLLKKLNEGVSAARNDGFKLSTGRYVCFVDSDDYWDNDMKDVLGLARIKENDLICYGLTYEFPNNDYTLLSQPTICGLFNDKSSISGALLEYDSKRLLESPCNKIYSKKIIDQHNIRFPIGVSNLEDFEFNCKFIVQCRNIYISHYASYHYVFFDNITLSSKYKPDMLNAYENISKLRVEMFSAFGYNKVVETHCISKQRDYLILCLSNLYREDSPLSRKERINEVNRIKSIGRVKRVFDSKEGVRSLYTKILTKVINRKSIVLIDTTCKLMYIMRYVGKGIYTKHIRKVTSTFR
ncbi:glycosyltransferase family 2 protein [Neobacillus niacini]|uniref:glycosyltransferase family 2 protein n=1 Tax=Neobacillus niacini TaxID=86668 RepID=UPI0005F07771|nr:glycosyltransferase [Neobacillus niacini]